MGLLQPDGRHGRRDGGPDLSAGTAQGHLAGLARHGRARGPIEVIDAAAVTYAGGIEGDWRGAMKGKPWRRQVTLMEADAWSAACADLALHAPWWQRRVNLLVAGLRIPHRPGVWVRIGTSCVLETTDECNPCHRMEDIAPGLKAALTPDWRGGFLATVIEEGPIAVGDSMRIEE